MSKEYTDLASAYFAGDYQNDPGKARRAAQMMRFMKPGPNGQLDAESVAQGVRSFEMFETERTNFGGQLTDLGLPEESVNAVSDVMANLSIQTGMDHGRMVSAFQGFYETRLDQRARGMAPEDLSPQERAVAARQAKAMMGQLAGMVQENPLLAPMVEQALSGRGGLALNFESAVMRTPQGLATEMKRVYERGGRGYEEARQLHREGHIPATDIPKYTAAVLYKHAGDGVFEVNPELEQYLGGLGNRFVSKTRGNQAVEQARQVVATDATPEAKSLATQVAVLSLASTPEGRQTLDDRMGALELSDQTRAKVVAAAEMLAPVAEFATADPKKQKQLLAEYESGRIYSHGVAEPGDLVTLRKDMAAYRSQLAGVDGAEESVQILDELVQWADAVRGERETALPGAGETSEEKISRWLDAAGLPKPETVTGFDSASKDKRRRLEVERGRAEQRLIEALREGKHRDAVRRGLGSMIPREVNQDYRTGIALGNIPLKAFVRKGAPDLRLRDIYTADQLSQMRTDERGFTKAEWADVVDGLLDDLERRGLLRVGLDARGSGTYSWEIEDSPGYKPNPARRYGEPTSLATVVNLKNRNVDLSSGEAVIQLMTELAPTPELKAAVRRQASDQADHYMAMREAHEAEQLITGLGVDLGDPRLLPEVDPESTGLSRVQMAMLDAETKKEYLRRQDLSVKQAHDMRMALMNFQMQAERDARRYELEELRQNRLDKRQQDAARGRLMTTLATDDEMRYDPKVQDYVGKQLAQ
jgi:hypothetical protein